MRRFGIPDAAKEEYLQEVRSRLEAATPKTKKPGGNPEFKPISALIFWTTVLGLLYWWFTS